MKLELWEGYMPISLSQIKLDPLEGPVSIPLHKIKLDPLEGPVSTPLHKIKLDPLEGPVSTPLHKIKLDPLEQPETPKETVPRIRCRIVSMEQQSLCFESFKGSAYPIPFDGGYLSIIHETVERDRRYYIERFLWYSQEPQKKIKPRKMSPPFYFVHKGIEFSCGMTMSFDGKTIIVGLGIEDGDSYVLPVSVERVRSMLIDM
jgi:hypothetical protein